MIVVMAVFGVRYPGRSETSGLAPSPLAPSSGPASAQLPRNSAGARKRRREVRNRDMRKPLRRKAEELVRDGPRPSSRSVREKASFGFCRAEAGRRAAFPDRIRTPDRIEGAGRLLQFRPSPMAPHLPTMEAGHRRRLDGRAFADQGDEPWDRC